MSFRDRIVGFERRKASEIEPHPENWRIHPDAQRTALTGALTEVGMVDAVIARKLPGGKLQLVDGHLRRDLLGDEEVPVIVTDLTAAEAKLVLATFDPLSELAETNEDIFTNLLAELTADDGAVNELLETMGAKMVAPADFPEIDLEQETDHRCPSCGYEWR